jgi:hypothetical protein
MTGHAVMAGAAPASRAHAARQDRNFFTIKEIEIRAFSPLYSSKSLNGLGMNGSRLKLQVGRVRAARPASARAATEVAGTCCSPRDAVYFCGFMRQPAVPTAATDIAARSS